MSTAVAPATPVATPTDLAIINLLTAGLPSDTFRNQLLHEASQGPRSTTTVITANFGQFRLELNCNSAYVSTKIKPPPSPSEPESICWVSNIMSYDDVCRVLGHFATLAANTVSSLEHDHTQHAPLEGEDLVRLMQGNQNVDAWGKVLAQVKALQQLHTTPP